eukprot:749965-Hanusia_phi.AAC.1
MNPKNIRVETCSFDQRNSEKRGDHVTVRRLDWSYEDRKIIADEKESCELQTEYGGKEMRYNKESSV